MDMGKIDYCAFKVATSLEFLASGIAAAGAVFSVTQKQYDLGGFLAFVSLYIGVDAYGRYQDIERIKYMNEVRKPHPAVAEALKRNNEAFDKFFDKTSKAP
jgi:hypothetical protein